MWSAIVCARPPAVDDYVGGTGAEHGERIPVMTVGGTSRSPSCASMILRMRDLPRCDPASGELSHRAVEVIGIENHEVVGQFVVGDFGENQSLHSDRPVDLAVIAKHQAVQHQARSPDGDRLCLLLPTRCRLEEQRAREVRLDQPLVTQPFSPVLISSVCSDNGKEAVKVAAVECIHHACENPGRGVLQVRRCDIELVEPCERGVKVCLVEDLAAVDQRRLRTSEW